MHQGLEVFTKHVEAIFLDCGEILCWIYSALESSENKPNGKLLRTIAKTTYNMELMEYSN